MAVTAATAFIRDMRARAAPSGQRARHPSPRRAAPALSRGVRSAAGRERSKNWHSLFGCSFDCLVFVRLVVSFSFSTIAEIDSSSFGYFLVRFSLSPFSLGRDFVIIARTIVTFRPFVAARLNCCRHIAAGQWRTLPSSRLLKKTFGDYRPRDRPDYRRYHGREEAATT